MGDMQILKATGAKPQVTFYADGTATDLDTGVPTVTITRPDGSTIPSGMVSHIGATGSGTYEFVLAPLADLTLLTIDWSGLIGGVTETVTTTVEVVGAFLFTLAAMRAVKVAGGTPFASTTDYPNQTLLDRRAEVTDDFEARCGWSFVPRFSREVKDGDGTGTLVLDHLKASKLLSVTVGGVAQDVANYTLDRAGVLRPTSNYMASGWFPPGVGNVVVEYVHGFDRPPAVISSAGMARTAMLLLPSQAGSSVSTWTTPDGTTYQRDLAGQAIAGGGVRHFGVPGIDSVLNASAYNARGLAVA